MSDTPRYQFDESNPLPAKSEEQLSLKAGGLEAVRMTRGPGDTGIAGMGSLRFSFVEEGKEIGTFWYEDDLEKDEQVWRFKGNADASAKLFVEHVLKKLTQ